MAGEQTLAQLIKAKYPQYGKLGDTELEEMILKKYPQQYGHLPRTKKPTEVVAAPSKGITGHAKDVVKGFGKQGKEIITGLPAMAMDTFRTMSDPMYRLNKGVEAALQFQEDPTKSLLETQEGLTGIKIAGDQPVGEKVGASLANLAAILAPLKGARMMKGKTKFKTTPGGVRDPLKPGLTQEELLAKVKEREGQVRAPEDVINIGEQTQQVSEAATGTKERPVPQRLAPRLVGKGEAFPLPGKAADRAVALAIMEGILPKEVIAARRNAAGRLGKKSATAAETLTQLLEDIRTTKDLPERVDLPPSEPPPMPKTGTRTAPLPPGRPIPEPGGALGLGEESAAAGRRALARSQRSKGEERPTKKQQRDAEIDELADKAEQEALSADDDAPVPGTVQFVSYEKGATPAQAAATAAKQRAAESAAVRAVPRENLVVEGAAPGAKPGQAKLPALPKTRKAAGQPEASALPERPTVNTEIKAANNRKKLMGTIRKLETGDSSVDRKARRIVYLADLESRTAAQTAEMATLERELLASPKVPDILKRRWQKVNDQTKQATRPATRAAEAVAAKNRLPTKANGDTRPLSQRSEDLAARISRPKAEPKGPPPEDLAAAVAESLPKPPAPSPAKAKASGSTAPATTPGAAPVKGAQAAVAAIMAGRRPAGAKTLVPLIEQSRRALPSVRQAMEEAGVGQGLDDLFPAAAEGGDVSAVGSRAASQITQEFGTGTGYRPNIPSRPSIRIPKGFTGPTGDGNMKRAPIVRKAADLKAKVMKSYKRKPVEEQAPRVLSRMEVADIPTVKKPVGEIKKAQTYREQQAAQQAAGPAPRGVEPDTWRWINGVENEARNLVKDGIHDPRLIKSMIDFWGAEHTVEKLGLTDYMKAADAEKYIKDLTNTKPWQRPASQVIAEMDARFRHLIDDPHGFIRTETLAAGGGALAGGLAGATIEGEDAADRVAYAISGALLGGGLAFAGIRGVQAAAKSVPGFRKNKAAYAEALDTANLLSSPAAIKASLGSMGGVAHGLWERLATGDIKGFRRGVQALKEAPGIYIKTLTGPTQNLRQMGRMTQQIANQTGVAGLPEKILLNVLRPFIAADKAASHVLRRAGHSAGEAERLLLMGEPVSWRGQALLNFINGWMPLRLAMKFPRVRIGALERAVEFTPGLSGKYGQAIRSQSGRMGKFVRQEGISKKQLRARSIFGGAAIGAYSIYGYYRDPSLAESAIATSMAGPAQIPAAVGVAAGKAMRRGTTGAPLLVAIGEPALGSVPQISESDLRMLPERFVPGAPAVRALRRFGLID